MFSSLVSSAVMALAASHLVSAQTFTDCDPLEKTCPPDAAFGKDQVSCDFTSECKAFDALPGTTVTYDDQGALLTIEKESNAPTMATHKRIFFGRVDVELQAAKGQGIVTSVVFESADLDEIDWEWIGGDNAQVQTNYFGKGDTTTYDRGAYHDVAEPLTTVHMYSIEWTPKAINWEIDGAVVRTVKYEEAKGGSRFPQTPMEIKIGTWVAGGKNSAPGTVEWAGGYTDFSKAPFNAYYKSINIVDYAGKDAPTKDSIKEYVWTDKTGSYESIQIVKGDSSSDDGDDEAIETKNKAEYKTAEPTKTKTKTVETATVTTESSEIPAASSSSFTSASGSPTPSSTGGAAPGASEVPEDAATDVFASFGRITVAGAAAVLVAQLF